MKPKTHTRLAVSETCGDNTYNVRMRTEEETARLHRLIATLDPKKTFAYRQGDKTTNIIAISGKLVSGIMSR